MSIIFVEEPRRHAFSPMERMVIRVFDDSFRKLDESLRSKHQTAELDEAKRNLKLKKTNANDSFKVELDVSAFNPEDLSVNVRGNELIVEGRHEERSDDHGLIERRFVRKYPLPKNLNQDLIESHLSDKGILSVIAKQPTVDLEKTKPRSIPIQSSKP